LRTKAIIVTNPHNPTGKVFSRGELELIAELCQQHDTLAITDEIYEHILYDGARHVPLASLPGMSERTITVNSMSKTFSVTGWRVGWIVAAPDLADSIRKVHDFLTVNSPAPMQQAAVMALGLDDSFFAGLADHYRRRRDMLFQALTESGFAPFQPQGAYYIMANVSGFGFDDDMAFARDLMERGGVACVPGSSFFDDPADGAQLVRFCFCKKEETLAEAGRRLRAYAGK
jgi:aspartate/methionine/tyrosine aminotransferase